MKTSNVTYLIKKGISSVWKNIIMSFASFSILLVSLLQGMEKNGGRWADPACRALLLPGALEAAADFSAKNCLVHGAFDCGVPVPASVHDRIYEGV